MTFSEMRKRMLDHFAGMTQLFEVAADKDKLWDLYLNSFPKSRNPIYRERTEHDCSCCRHFIKTMGCVITIKDGKVISIWDFDIDGDDTYAPSVKALSEYVHSLPIVDAFYSKIKRIGTEHNKEITLGQINTYEHFYCDIPEKFVTAYVPEKKGQLRDTRNVFKRSLDELTAESVSIVLELIAQGSLYRGEEHKAILEQFALFKTRYDKLNPAQKEIFAWEFAADAGMSAGRIRNHAIGTLLVDISAGVPLDNAVSSYERIVAPSNYKRPKAIFTQRMLDEAKQTLTDLGYINSLKRRYATLDDITINNILFANRDAARRIAGDDVFAEMAATIAVDPKKFDKVEEIGIDAFLTNVLPGAREIELLFESNLTHNMVSLIAPVDKDSKTMFKWNNNFCWAYTGNIADSMKERVKAAGGDVTGDLRFTIQWNENGKDDVDLDAHCLTPDKHEIYFGNKYDSRTKGELDVDIQCPSHQIRGDDKTAVENITWQDRKLMTDGIYKMFVHQYRGRLNYGFRAEIEFDGQIFSFDYAQTLLPGERVAVADVELRNGVFFAMSLLPESRHVSSREVWGLSTNQFIPVTTIMMSPNYWDDQNGIGNKHYFFMLKDCVNPENPNGFYNEYLNNELDKHKRVMEALGTKLAVAKADDQLSGVGFSSTIHNHIILKVKGSTERIIKVII